MMIYESYREPYVLQRKRRLGGREFMHLQAVGPHYFRVVCVCGRELLKVEGAPAGRWAQKARDGWVMECPDCLARASLQPGEGGALTVRSEGGPLTPPM